MDGASTVNENFHATLPEEPHQISRVEKMTMSLAGIPDGEHVDTSGDLGNRKVSINTQYRVSGQTYYVYVDENPLGSTAPTFGSTVRFNFGLAGHAMLYGVDVCFKLKTLANNSEYVPWIAERLMGEEYQVKYQSEPIMKMNMDALHFRRRLEQDISTVASGAYNEAVGQNSTEIGREVWFPLDFHFNEKKPLVAIANSSELELRFTIPAAAELIRAKNANVAYDPAVAGAALEALGIEKVYLRCKYADVDQSSRFALAKHALQKSIRYHVSHCEVGESADASHDAAATGDDVKRHTIDIRSIVQPSAFLYAIVRYKADLQASVADAGGAVAALSDLFNTGSPIADRFNAIPPISWGFLERNQLVYPRLSWQYYSLAQHPQLFNSEPFQPIVVVNHADHPTLARDHSTGHVTYTNMNQPRLQIDTRKAVLASDDSPSMALDDWDLARRYFNAVAAGGGAWGIAHAVANYATVTVPLQIDVFSAALNFLYHRNGRLFYAYT